MDRDLIKLAYQLGYKQAFEMSGTPLFDPRTGALLPDFAQNFDAQQAADSSLAPAAVGLGSAYMAGKTLFTDPVKALEARQAKYIANLGKTTGVRGLYNRAMNYVSPSRANVATNKTVARLGTKINAARAMKHPWLRRIGKGGLWGTAAALALGSLAYRNDWI